MASMWKRGSRCQYPGTEIVAVRVPVDLGIFVRPLHHRLPSVT
jgi:hypothetical protein